MSGMRHHRDRLKPDVKGVEVTLRRAAHPTRLQIGVVGVACLLMCSCQSVTTRPGAAANSTGKAKAFISSEEPSRAGAIASPKQAPQPLADEQNVPDTSLMPAKDADSASSAVSAPTIVSWPDATMVASTPSSHAACPHCSPGAASLPASAFGGAWGQEFVRPPYEEYVCNGGDHVVDVQVKQDWSVQGLNDGDTVVHYDTIDGRTFVEPSNEVCLYAPRFAAVRKVYGIVAHEQHDRAAGVELPVGAELSSELGQPTTVSRHLQAGRKHSITGMQAFLDKTRGIGLDNALHPVVAEEHFLPFEDLSIIRRGVFDNTEKARLAERLAAAVAWSHDQGPQVAIDNRMAVESVGTIATESVYIYELPPGKSKLRVVKIASKQNAKPGELVEFTLRFDNVGDQLIGNVTVLDRLHDRLEYVPDSQRCSLPAEFLTEDEDESPRVLRWEITAPMKVGEGGLIRFTCRVR